MRFERSHVADRETGHGSLDRGLARCRVAPDVELALREPVHLGVPRAIPPHEEESLLAVLERRTARDRIAGAVHRAPELRQRQVPGLRALQGPIHAHDDVREDARVPLVPVRPRGLDHADHDVGRADREIARVDVLERGRIRDRARQHEEDRAERCDSGVAIGRGRVA